jgi:two-component system chemotaxis response regulator CheY
MAFNVLVVDDSAVMRGMMIKTLRLSGLPLRDIHQAGNGQEGLRMLREHWIDLALVDINMPVMNGEELVDQIRQEPELASVRVIVVSTEGSETRIEALRQMGAEFVHKPFTPEMLRDTVLRVTGVTNEQLARDEAASSSDADF